MEWKDIERLAHDFHLDTAVLRQAALPAIAFTPAATSEPASPTGSYFGGRPLLPAGVEWPVWSPARFCAAERQTARDYIERHPSATPHWTKEIRDLDELEARGELALQFMAQLDLAKLAAIGPTYPLPSTGSLLIFAEFNVTGAAAKGRAEPTPPWRLLWCPGDLPRSPAEPPSDKEGLLHDRHVMVPGLVFSFPEKVVRGREVVYEGSADDGYGQFLSALESIGVRGRNQVGGHPFRLQAGDIQEAVTHRHAGFDLWSPPPDEADRRLAEGSADWKFLLQITEDYVSPEMFVGVASFWGKPRSVETGDFGEVELHYEDT